MQFIRGLTVRSIACGFGVARVVASVTIATLALGVVPVSVGAQQPAGAQNQGSERARRYRATTPFLKDTTTGQRRMPTDEEIAQVVQSLSTLTQRPENAPTVQTSTGATIVNLQGGYNGVLLGRVTEDGALDIRCVFTFEEGIGFLGLVPVIE